MKKVVVIGTGKVATHLTKALVNADCQVVQIVGRSYDSIKRMQQEMGIVLPFTWDKNQVQQDADLYICSVKDDAIQDALTGIQIPPHALLVHTSGSVHSQVLAPYATHYGVLYPMQTFSYGKEVDFSKVALYIDANSDKQEQRLLSFANKLSSNIKVVDSAMRAKVHLAAVFACNFTNHLYALAEKILSEVNLPFSDLLPLVDETTEKIHTLSPRKAQTGPAIRGDKQIIEKQLAALNGREKDIYQLLTESIQDDKF